MPQPMAGHAYDRGRTLPATNPTPKVWLVMAGDDSTPEPPPAETPKTVSVTCDLLFFEHLAAGVPPEQIRIEQEVYLDVGVYADIRVMTGSAPDYFVEVDVGY